MSIALMSRVWTSHEPREAADRLMLLALADNANDEGVCWPSVARLALKCAVAPRNVIKTLGRLEAAGLLRVERVTGRVNRYHVLPRTPDAGVTPDVRVGGDVGITPDADDTGTPDVDDTGPLTPASPEPTRTTRRTQNNNTGARGRSAVDALGTSGASEGGVVVGEDGAIEMLLSRGVAVGTAGSLVRSHGSARCREAAEAFDADALAGKAHTAGWLVKAIRSGWALRPAGGPTGGEASLLSYAEMLSECERTGRTTEAYEAVRIEGEDKPRWRVRPVASMPDGSGPQKRPSASAGPGVALP